jgi:hypothetical protein
LASASAATCAADCWPLFSSTMGGEVLPTTATGGDTEREAGRDATTVCPFVGCTGGGDTRAPMRAAAVRARIRAPLRPTAASVPDAAGAVEVVCGCDRATIAGRDARRPRTRGSSICLLEAVGEGVAPRCFRGDLAGRGRDGTAAAARGAAASTEGGSGCSCDTILRARELFSLSLTAGARVTGTVGAGAVRTGTAAGSAAGTPSFVLRAFDDFLRRFPGGAEGSGLPADSAGDAEGSEASAPEVGEGDNMGGESCGMMELPEKSRSLRASVREGRRTNGRLASTTGEADFASARRRFLLPICFSGDASCDAWLMRMAGDGVRSGLDLDVNSSSVSMGEDRRREPRLEGE